MNKALIIFWYCTIVCITNSYGQKDTVWSKYLTLRVSKNKTPTTFSAYNTKSIEILLQKGNHTIAPEVSRKSIHGLIGFQIGLAYYKKFDWGYTHVDLHYSKSPLSPHISIRSNLFYTLRKGIEINGGYSQFTYENGVKLSTINLGTSIYYKSTMTTCNMKISNVGKPQYIGMIRKYTRNEADYFQASISNAFEERETIGDTNTSFQIYSYQFGIAKTIIRRLQLQASFGISNVLRNDSTNKYFNYSLGLKRKF